MANKNNIGISQYGAFEYRIGSDTATVKHYNIRNATLAKREKVASELKKLGIRKILSDGKYSTVRKFLRLNNAPKKNLGGYVPGALPARYTHKHLELAKFPST